MQRGSDSATWLWRFEDFSLSLLWSAWPSLRRVGSSDRDYQIQIARTGGNSQRKKRPFGPVRQSLSWPTAVDLKSALGLIARN